MLVVTWFELLNIIRGVSLWCLLGSLSSRSNGEVISNGVKKGDAKKLLDDSDFMERRLSGRGGDEGEEDNDDEEADSGSEDAVCSKVAKVNGVSKDPKPLPPPADSLVHRKGKAAGAGRDDAISRQVAYWEFNNMQHN